MSRQQIRSSGDGAIDPSLVQKKRARHRLVGAVCLCLLAALIVPLVLESEPKTRDRDLPMELAAPPQHSAGAQQASAPVAAAGQNPSPGMAAPHGPRADAGAPEPASAQSAVKTITPPGVGPSTGSPASAGKPEGRPDAKAESKPDAKGASRSPVPKEKPASRADEPDVLARLIDRANHPGSNPASNSASVAAARDGTGKPVLSRKFLVQIGAFSNVQSARSVSDRAVQAGLRPYQETVKTAQGDWIRVRIGPFPTRQDAERAQQDLKRAGVTAAIIAL